MLRWILVLVLLLGGLGVPGSAWLVSCARAQEVPAPTDQPVAKPADQPADQPVVKPADQPADQPATKPADQPAAKPDDKAAPHGMPTKSDIHDLLDAGKARDAEAAYLEWAAYWKDDDPTLIVLIEHAIFLQQYKDGKNGALLTLADLGDREALHTMTTQALSPTANWSPAELAAAIGIIGRGGEKTAQNTLRTFLYRKEPEVVNASIVALGKMADKRLVPVLYKMFDTADAEQSILLARALAGMGAGKQVTERFVPQLRFPQPGVKEKAALVLGALGNPVGWPVINNVIESKKAPFHPLALSVLSTLPFPESQTFVRKALDGNEAEQLAALKSLNILPQETVEPMLLTMLRDGQRPASVRQAVVRIFAARKAQIALKDLHALAWALSGDAPQVRAQAISALPDYGLMKDLAIRESVRQRFDSSEEDVSHAARVILLQYALETTSFDVTIKH